LQLVDIFTKPLDDDQFNFIRSELGTYRLMDELRGRIPKGPIKENVVDTSNDIGPRIVTTSHGLDGNHVLGLWIQVTHINMASTL